VQHFHEPWYVEGRNEAIGQRAVEFAVDAEIVQFAAKPKPLAPAFDGDQDRACQCRDGREHRVGPSDGIRLRQRGHDRMLPLFAET
jgi:hypothetical protein